MKPLNLRIASSFLGCVFLFACGGGPAPEEGQRTAQSQEESPPKAPDAQDRAVSSEIEQLLEWIDLIVEDARLQDERLRDDLRIEGEIRDEKDRSVEYDLTIRKDGEIDGTVGNLTVDRGRVSNPEDEVFAKIIVVKGMRSVDLRVVEIAQDDRDE